VAGPSTSPWINPASRSTFKCWLTVDCASGVFLTISFVMHTCLSARYSTILKRTGLPSALSIFASRCFSGESKDCLAIYRNFTINQDFVKGCKARQPDPGGATQGHCREMPFQRIADYDLLFSSVGKIRNRQYTQKKSTDRCAPGKKVQEECGFNYLEDHQERRHPSK